jgi:hypothetical protein
MKPTDTSTAAPADHRASRRFVACLLLVLIVPSVLVCGLANLVVWRMAASTSPVEIARIHHDHPQLAWVGPLKLYTAVKAARLRLERPEVTVIGASRMGQFRSGMFKPYGFYNASMTGWTFESLYDVLDDLGAHPPRVVIFNLEYFMFDADWEDFRNTERQFLPPSVDYQSLAFSRGSHWGWWYLEATRPGRRSTDQFGLFGLTASLGGTNSFLHDGSMHYLPETFDRPVQQTALDRSTNENSLRMDPDQIARLAKLAELARRRGVTLIGVQMPLPKATLDILNADRDFQVHGGRTVSGMATGIWRQFQSAETRDLFRRLGILFADLSQLPEASDDRAFVNPLHPGEYLVLCSVIAMLKDPLIKAALPAIDVSALEETRRRAAADGNYFDLFKDRF